MAKRGSKTLSGIALNTYGTLMYFFCQWLLTVVVARINGYAEAGVFSLAISFANIFNYVELWGIRNFQISDVQGLYSNGDYSGTRIVSTAIALVLVPITLLLYGYERDVVLCCVAAVLFKTEESVTDLFFGTMQRQNRYDWIAVSYTLKGVIPAGMLLAAIMCGMTLYKAIFSMTAGYFLVLVFYDVLHLRGSGIFNPRMKSARKLLRLCFPLMLNGLISAYMIYIPRNAVQQILGSEELGFYASVSTVVVVLSTLSGSVWAALMPEISIQVTKNNWTELKKMFWEIMAILTIVSCFTLLLGNLLGPTLFSIVYGKEILSHMFLLTPVLLNAIMLMVDAFFDCYFIPMQKRAALLVCNGAGLILCFAMVSWATVSVGTVGACCSMTAGLLLRFIMLIVLNQSYLKKGLNHKESTEQGNNSL